MHAPDGYMVDGPAGYIPGYMVGGPDSPEYKKGFDFDLDLTWT